jgi:hypothetical protein
MLTTPADAVVYPAAVGSVVGKVHVPGTVRSSSPPTIPVLVGVLFVCVVAGV